MQPVSISNPSTYFLDCDDQSYLCKDAPLILFTHIPLYRFPGSNCGPLREKGWIPAVRGDGYQTLLSLETSELLLNELGPTLIFRYLLSLYRYFELSLSPPSHD